MSKVRVLIVEDSAVARHFLEYVIGSDGRLEVAGSVASAEQALLALDRLSPDVISLDICLPGMDGFEATRCIMAARPTPIVLVSATVERHDVEVTMQALEAGALAAVEKPVGLGQRGYQEMAEHLCTQLAIMSEVKVVRQRARPEFGTLANGRQPAPGPYRAVGIAASTGGPGALAQLLPALGRDFALPILLVQHIGPAFLNGFCRWLASVSPMPVQVVQDRARPEPGNVYVAGIDRHLTIGNGLVCAEQGDPVAAHRASATVLFRSLAQNGNAIGVLLTGMGDDGADGLLELRKAGGHTIAEHESTAVVCGMPAAAAQLGAVCESLPLQAIGPRLLELASRRLEVNHE